MTEYTCWNQVSAGVFFLENIRLLEPNCGIIEDIWRNFQLRNTIEYNGKMMKKKEDQIVNQKKSVKPKKKKKEEQPSFLLGFSDWDGDFTLSSCIKFLLSL
ncbi:TPA: hypothetical protein U2C07_002213 [Streptococcus suis]|nr:hypothetical protein [Streptococcus suis]